MVQKLISDKKLGRQGILQSHHEYLNDRVDDDDVIGKQLVA